MRKFVAVLLIPLLFLAACGGGGGYGGGGGGPPPPTGQTIAPPGTPNVETLTVEAGPAGSINTAFVSVKVCAPGSTTTCKTIDHIEVDTGSTGLRIISTVLSAAPALTLPAEMDGSGHPFAECLQFADGTAWGSLATADITLPVSGETAAGVHVHVIGDPTYPTVPPSCTGNPENTVQQFGANGILGVGPFLQDCGPACVAAGTPFPVYYSCPTPGTCSPANASLMQQIPNPVTLFAADNNGVIVELPSVGSVGAATASGSLVFGIGTRTNNALGSATVLLADPNTGFITSTYKGTAFTGGYLDSGSNANFFTDSSIGACASPNQGFYCPGSTLSETATLKGSGASTITANFSVGDAVQTFNAYPNYTAFSSIAGKIPNPPPAGQPQPFDFGLAFFYGRNVFTAIENANTPGGIGPYFAF